MSRCFSLSKLNKRQAFTRLIVLFLAYMLLRLYGFTLNPFPSNEWKTYSDLENRFQIDYPAKWTARGAFPNEQRAGVVAFILAPNALLIDTQVYIALPSIPQSQPTAIAQWVEERLRGDLIFRELEPIHIEGQEFLSRHYTKRDSNLVFKDVYFTRDGTAIVLTLQTTEERYDDYLPLFERMVASFQLHS